MKKFQSYVICTSRRSGSTLLCQLLREVGDAGSPDSHFHEPSLEKWLGYYGFRKDECSTEEAALQAVFRSAYEHGKGGGQDFGLRLQRHSFGFFIEQLSILGGFNRSSQHPGDGGVDDKNRQAKVRTFDPGQIKLARKAVSLAM